MDVEPNRVGKDGTKYWWYDDSRNYPLDRPRNAENQDDEYWPRIPYPTTEANE